MNTLKKIGLTALGTSLVAGSAYAGEITASGDAGYTWSSEDVGETKAVNEGYGYNHDITFSGSGELDNGFTVSTTMILVESSALSSSNVTLGMGGLGSITIGSGWAGVGGNYDDMTPRAYEENHDGMATSTAIDNMGALMDGNVVHYTSPSFDLAGASASFMLGFTPEASDTATGEGAVAAQSAAYGSAKELGIKVGYAGLTAGAYGMEVENDQGAESGAYYFTYTMGPASIGYSKAYKAPIMADATTSAGATTIEYYDQTNYSIAYAANDDLSVSYEKETSEANYATSTTATVEQESSGVQIAYTMGGMTLALSHNNHDNIGYATNSEVDQTLIAVTMAF